MVKFKLLVILILCRTQYGLYQEAVSLCRPARKGIFEEKWKKAKFMVFDAPSVADKPYEVCSSTTM
jgi:hypothetical protein